MLKKYTSKSDLSCNVCMKNGKYAHLSFSPVTGGGSVYYTDDEELQQAIEAHPKFGHLFKLEETVNEKADEDNGTEIAGAGETPVETKDATEGDETPATEEVHVSSLDDAKEYLSDHFGISRTKLKSKAAILASAAENGVRFAGLE